MPKPKREAGPTPHDLEALSRLRISFIRRGSLVVDGADEPVLLMDLARHGAFVERREPLALGREVTLEFSLPGNELPVRARCRVAWTQEPQTGPHALPQGLGLEFVSLEPEDLARVDALLLEHLGRPARARQFSGRHLPR